MHAGARYLDEAETAQARRLVSIGAINRDTASHRQAPHLSILFIHKPFRARAEHADVMHQPMLRQILQRLRHTIAFEVRGAGAVDHREVAQVPRHHRLIRLRANAHHTIKALAEQIDAAVGAADFQLQIRMSSHELRQQRHDQAPREDVRHVDTNPPAQRGRILPKQPLDLIHVRQQILAAFVQHQAVLSRLHLARGALQQAGAEQGFQGLDVFGNRRARQPETLAGQGETRQFADPDEGAQQFQFVHEDTR